MSDLYLTPDELAQLKEMPGGHGIAGILKAWREAHQPPWEDKIELAIAECFWGMKREYHKAGIQLGVDDSVKRYHGDLCAIASSKLVALKAAREVTG